MIIAALYVILLVAFTQESYMRRDFDLRRAMASDVGGRVESRVESSAAWPVIQDISRRICRIEPPFCGALFADAGGTQSCVNSLEAVRRFIGAPAMPTTLEELRRAMREHAEPGK